MIISIDIRVIVNNDCFLNNGDFDYGGEGEELLKRLIIEKIKSNGAYNHKQRIIDSNGNPVGIIKYSEEYYDETNEEYSDGVILENLV